MDKIEELPLLEEVKIVNEVEETEEEEEEEEPKKTFYISDLVTMRIKKTWDCTPIFGTVVGKNARASSPRLGTPEDQEGFQEKVNVLWDSSNKLMTSNAVEIALVDRQVLRGQRVKSELGVSGTVVDTSVTATIQIVGTNKVIEDISLDELKPICPFVRGQEVILDDWIGIVTMVRKKIYFRTARTLTYNLEVHESDGFLKDDPYSCKATSCPGVKTPMSPSVLRHANWTSSTMRFFWRWIPPLPYIYSLATSKVLSVECTGVLVKWLCLKPNHSEETQPGDEAPIPMVEKDDLQRLVLVGSPSTESVGINSVRLYTLKESDKLVRYIDWFTKFRSEINDQASLKMPQLLRTLSLTTLVEDPHNINGVCVKVLVKKNCVNILWDNGTTETMPTIDIPYLLKEVQEASFPTGIVVALVPIANVQNFNEENVIKYGIVQQSESFVAENIKMVRVQWFRVTETENIQTGEKSEKVETELTNESIYDIKPHPEFALFQRGSIVFLKGTKLQAGVISDIDFKQGKTIIVTPAGIKSNFYPHQVIPMSQRAYWNFYERKWVVEELILLPYQLGVKQNNWAKGEIVRLPNNSNKNVNDQSVKSIWDEPNFQLFEHAPPEHSYINGETETYGLFAKNVSDEIRALKDFTPEGTWIRAYSDRMDLFSVLLVGPMKTPYEDVLFVFDVQLTKKFPAEIPKLNYISYNGEIHPLLSEDGTFCRHFVNWDFSEEIPNSYLGYLFTEVQTLLFHSEPYFRNPYKIELKRDPVEKENSRAYNEMVYLRTLEGAYFMVKKSHPPWNAMIANHHSIVLPEKLQAIENLLKYGENKMIQKEEAETSDGVPNYPLFPVSTGFQKSLLSRLSKIHWIFSEPLIDLESVSKILLRTIKTSSEVKMEKDVESNVKPLKIGQQKEDESLFTIYQKEKKEEFQAPDTFITVE